MILVAESEATRADHDGGVALHMNRLALAPLSLHPDTSPQAIADAQRSDVAEAAYRLGRHDIDGISEAVCLPLWTVKRRLAEIFDTALPAPKMAGSPRPRKDFAKVIEDYLHANPRSSASAIEKACGLASGSANHYLASQGERFCFKWGVNVNKKAVKLWSAKDAK
jgi:hypothetical protein